MKFTCDPSSIDKEIDCNCFSSCDEVVYDADIVISDYQKDEIEKTKTEKYGNWFLIAFDLLPYFQ